MLDFPGMSIKGIVFDLDGTLLDTIDDLTDSCNRILKQYGFPEHPAGAYKKFVGSGVRNLVERALPESIKKFSQLDEFILQFREDYSVHCFDKTRPYPGIMEMLERLHNRGIPMAILSNKPDAETRSIAARYFGTELFKRVYGHREEYGTKPDPAGAKAILAELGLKGEEAAFVGDTWTDMQTAAATGCLAVGVLWGFRDRQELEENGAQKIASDADDLFSILMEA